MKQTLLITTNNHFDPTWRRCWERRFVDRGRTFVSYADLQEYYMLDNLELAESDSGYAFNAEFTLVVRKFLERHPERLEQLRRLVAEGRFEVTGGGELIIDSNMVLGESLVRNFLLGLLWVENELGQVTRMAVRNDAFGDSAQVPQILRGCEQVWALGSCYHFRGSAQYWRGLDGSVIVIGYALPIVYHGSSGLKYAPLADGSGSESDRRGIDNTVRAPLPERSASAEFDDRGVGWVRHASEEALPNPDILRWAREMKREYEVRFVVEGDLRDQIKDAVAAVDAPPEHLVLDSVERNPNNSGVWVTRIKTKQAVRRLEYALMTAEALATSATLLGASHPRAELEAAWRRLLFCMFHDAITGTLVDPAYAELEDLWGEVEKRTDALRREALRHLGTSEADAVTVINPTGSPSTAVVTAELSAVATPIAAVADSTGMTVPLLSCQSVGDGRTRIEFVASNVPAFGVKNFRLVEGPAPVTPAVQTGAASACIENERFLVEADTCGLTRIYDKSLRREISVAADVRPGELILEHDMGCPWSSDSPDRERVGLSCFTKLTACEKAVGRESLIFDILVEDLSSRPGDSGAPLPMSVRVTLTAGVPRVDFQTKVRWSGFNHRLRVAFPLGVAGRHIYGIPYGAIERRDYQEAFGWNRASGGWPAVNWAGVETTGARFGAALFNKGLPAYQIEPTPEVPFRETMFLSLLRSPTSAAFLHEPQYYTMTAFEGMRDEGDHCFEYALAAYGTHLLESSVAADAEAYNAGMPAVAGLVSWPELPQIVSDNARISAIKWAERGEALVLRVVEFRGREARATVSFPSWADSVEQVNLLERCGTRLPVVGGVAEIRLRPWEIATLRIRPGQK